MNLKEKWPLWLGVILFFLFTAWLFGQLAVTEVKAHNAPSGWSYPWECCSNTDCRPVECDTLEEIEGGKVRDIENGQVYERDMVKSSGDHHCHVCTQQGKVDGKPLCAFTVNGF